MADPVTEADVIVVGAGISGLTAAYHIIKKCPTMRVIVLEAKDRVGGRTLTEEFQTANGTDHWDLGGQWVGTSQTHIMELLNELGLKVHRQYTEGKKYMQLGGHRISSYRSSLPSLSPLALIDLNRFVTQTEAMRKCVSLSNPYTCKYAQLWDSMTVETFLQQKMWCKASKEAITAAIRTMLGVECSQISLLYLLMYCNANGGFERLCETKEDSAQGFVIKGGAQQISKELTKLIKEKDVHTNHPVSCIYQDDNGVTLKCEGGEMYRCQRVVIATPPHQTDWMTFQPPLPIEKKEIFKRMPVSLLTKVIITYAEAFWRKKGDCGEFVSNGGPIKAKGCLRGPVSVTYDCSSFKGNPALVVFLGGSPAVEWSCVEADERRKAVLDSLGQVWGADVYDYVDYREKDWSKEPYSGGSPVNCVAPGGMRYFSTGLRDPHHRVHFAGTESATVCCGYMSGAVQAGIRAATEVLHNLQSELVSDDELQDTYYGSKWHEPEYSDVKSSLIGRAAKWTLGLGLLASALFIGHRISKW